jgi:DNA polymerase-3 subunit epsilon
MISIDIEASAPDPQNGSILSLGAVDTDNPTNQFYDECRVWEGAHITPSALEVNGFTETEAQDPEKKTEAELIEAFIAWAFDKPQNRTLLAQNPGFDRDFLKAACLRAKREFPFADRTLDVHSLCWLHMHLQGIEPPTEHQHSKLNLDAALRYCGIPEEPKPHNALTGALCHAEVFARIAYNKNILEEFSSFEIPWTT